MLEQINEIRTDGKQKNKIYDLIKKKGLKSFSLFIQ